MRHWQFGGPGLLHQSMAYRVMSPHTTARDPTARSSKDQPSDPPRIYAEAEFAAFAASSKRVTDVKAKLPLGDAFRQYRCQGVKAGVKLRGAIALLGAESSWPHGVGTRPVSEVYTESLMSCNSMTCATNATAAAMLRSNSTSSRQPRTLPSISSSGNISAILGSHGRLKARHSVTPTSWQVGTQVHWSCKYIRPSSIRLVLAVFLPVASCVHNDICLKYLHFAGCLLKLNHGCRNWSL